MWMLGEYVAYMALAYNKVLCPFATLYDEKKNRITKDAPIHTSTSIVGVVV